MYAGKVVRRCNFSHGLVDQRILRGDGAKLFNDLFCITGNSCLPFVYSVR